MPAAPLRLPRSLPLPALVAAIFGFVPMHSAQATTLLVTDCSDGADSGTLRNTIAVAPPDNSTIQIPLKCSVVTVLGDIFIPNTVSNMLIVGQGASATEISAFRLGRAFYSFHTGTLTFQDVTITNGYYSKKANPLGGCIYAYGNVALDHAVVTNCAIAPLNDTTVLARGGAIFSLGNIYLSHSTVSGNTLSPTPSETSQGGGLFAAGGIYMRYSTVSGNSAYRGASAPAFSRGGGVFSAAGGVVIRNSTISGNKAEYNSAIQASGNVADGFLTIEDSTITGNVAGFTQTAGTSMAAIVTDSTIAYNRVGVTTTSQPAGLYSSAQVKMYSSIFASNTGSTGTANDVSSGAASNPLVGSHNLITATSNAMPAGTSTACPRLGHLSNNGGPTLTIPLLANSPALDTGAANGETTDQRGTGFPRPAGAAADIGAYERQPGAIDDVVFFSEFESRCD